MVAALQSPISPSNGTLTVPESAMRTLLALAVVTLLWTPLPAYAQSYGRDPVSSRRAPGRTDQAGRRQSAADRRGRRQVLAPVQRVSRSAQQAGRPLTGFGGRFRQELRCPERREGQGAPQATVRDRRTTVSSFGAPTPSKFEKVLPRQEGGALLPDREQAGRGGGIRGGAVDSPGKMNLAFSVRRANSGGVDSTRTDARPPRRAGPAREAF